MLEGVAVCGTKGALSCHESGIVASELYLMERILIVDDEEELAFSLDVALNMAGYQTTVCSDGIEALDKIVDSWSLGLPFSLIVTDIQMPGLNGRELIGEMRKRGMNTPVVAVTGYGDKEMMVELMRIGCDDFIEKPVDISDLLRNVRRIMERRHARREVDKIASEAVRDVEIYKRDYQYLRSQMESAVNSYNQIVKFNPKGLKVKLAYRYSPFASLGGDFFDARNYEDGVEALVADIAGHDMGASYHTVFIKTMFDRFAGIDGGGEALMRSLNEQLAATFDFGRLATALHIKLDLKRMKGRVVSAGHGGLLIFSRCKAGARSYSSGGPALGAMIGQKFEALEFSFQAGDRMFVHTDGLLNACRVDGRSGARKRLAEAGLIGFLDSHGSLSLEDMVGQAWNDVSAFCKRRFTDDALLLALEIPREE